jgi:hypothetical protein
MIVDCNKTLDQFVARMPVFSCKMPDKIQVDQQTRSLRQAGPIAEL